MTSSHDTGWVLIAGAGGALGHALAVHFAKAKRRVMALDRRFQDETELTNADVVTATLDASNEVELRRALDGAIGDGRISLLVNAIGRIWNEPCLSIQSGKFVSHGIESWREVIEANLTAPFIVANAVAARMARKRGGVIVNFSSISSGGNAGQAAYGAAKAGVEGWTRALAVELGPLGIRVNAVAPGFIDVKTTRAAVPDARLNEYIARTPTGRLGQITDLIGAIEFLEANSFVTGTVLRLDGGLRLS